MAIFPGSAIPSAVSDYEIENSLRTNRADGARLERTPSVAGNRRNWTFSAWVKISEETTTRDLFSCFSGSAYNRIEFEADGKLLWEDYTGSHPYVSRLRSSQVFRDPGSWYHILFRYDSPNATSADRVQFWINGERVTALDVDTQPSQNAETNLINTAIATYVAGGASGSYWGGYVAECYFIDGTSLDASSFGELDSDTNQWKPLDSDDVKDAVTFGTNGFYQKYNSTELAASFADSSQGGFVPSENLTVDALIVAGGGGGAGTQDGTCGSGGGGAGGYRSITGISVTASTAYGITVGAGGSAGAATYGTQGGDGGDSSFNTYSSTGGGGGGTAGDTGNTPGYGKPGRSGGSGGGGGTTSQAGGSGNAGSYSPVEGYAGGTSTGSNAGSGGGGASEVGDNATGNRGADGGDGVANSITGASVTYAGGGGGGSRNTISGDPGTGGAGGGGDGNGTAGTANTGGGGGGNKGGSSAAGGAGGSGVVIIRYISTTEKATGGTITSYTDGGNTYQVHKFTASDVNPRHTITANGDATNQRPQHHDVTANGDAHLIGPKQGTSVISYDGTGDYLSIPDSSDWDFGTDSFTIEMWLNTRDSSGYNGGVFSHWTDANNHHEIYLSDNVVYWQCMSGGSHVFTGLAASTVVTPENGWAHYAFVRNSTTFTIYKNGVAEDSTTDSDSIPALTAALEIGRIEGGSQYYTGYIDSYRISDSARYTADFTAPTSAFVNDGNTKLLIQSGTDGSQTFDDLSTPDHTITANGDVRWFAPKVGAGAMAFDGTTDLFTTPTSPSWDFGAGDFTIEFWLQPNVAPSVFAMLIERDSNATDKRSWGVGMHPTRKIECSINTDGTSGGWVNFQTTGTITLNTWTHIAYVRSGSSFKCYINGTADATTATDSSAVYNSDRGVAIGAYASTSYSLNGYIDGLRISKEARYTSTFTPSTTAFTDDINTALLLNADINQGTWAEDTSTGLAISTESRIEFDGSTDSLSIPSSSDFNMADDSWTIDFWVNFKAIPDNDYIFSQWTASGNRWDAYIYNNSGTLEWTYQINDASNFQMTMAATSLALGRWYHVELGVDASTEKGYWYLDGVRQTESAGWTSTNPNVDAAFYIFNPGPNINVAYGINGYMDEFRVSKGIIRHTGATFTPATRGNPYTADSYTKLLIHSDYTGGLGADSSGNYNNFTATNLVATDQMIDTPTNNFTTLNPLAPARASGSFTYSEGNLKVSEGGSGDADCASTIGVSSGKWYAEAYIVTGDQSTNTPFVGVVNSKFLTDETIADTSNCIVYYYTGNKRVNGTVSAYGSAYNAGDIVGIALDLDSGTKTVTFYDNNSTQGALTLNADEYLFNSGRTAGTPVVVWNFGQDSSFAGNKTAQGNQDGNEKGDFYYEPPSGYLALCTDNLPDPEIKLPGENFNTVLYTGDGVDGRAITGVGFQTDLNWVKKRNATGAHNVVDSVRGPANSFLETNSSGAAGTSPATVDSFDSDGFTVSDYANTNQDTKTFVAWNWKAGGSASANDDGSLDSTVSVNTTAGFSIVKYSGVDTPATNTVGHGLSVAPELWIIKSIDAASPQGWVANTTVIDGTVDYMFLNTDDAVANQGSPWSTLPTSSVFTLGANDGNTCNAGVDYIAYCFHSIEGYSKVGSYKGNGNANGPFIYTGFRPAYIMIKAAPSWSGGHWHLFDTKRYTYNQTSNTTTTGLVADSSGIDGGGGGEGAGPIDILSNGFKIRNSNGNDNANGDNIIFLAFAESPFKYSNAR